jgi:hypothetical protein
MGSQEQRRGSRADTILNINQHDITQDRPKKGGLSLAIVTGGNRGIGMPLVSCLVLHCIFVYSGVIFITYTSLLEVHVKANA